MNGRLAGRLALVTGASRGLGRAVARRFAAEGAHVVALGRTQGGLEELDDEIASAGGSATLVPIDLADRAAVEGMAAAIWHRFRRLDILVGNAAILGRLSPAGHFTPEIWDQVMAINLHANAQLIRLFDPLLRASPAGRAIFVTCAVARAAPAYWGAYAASKAALETLARTWADELAGVTPVRVNLVDPGALRTRLRAQAYPGEDPRRHPEPEAAVEPFVAAAAADWITSGELLRAPATV